MWCSLPLLRNLRSWIVSSQAVSPWLYSPKCWDMTQPERFRSCSAEESAQTSR